METLTKHYFVITDQMRVDAKEAMEAVYGVQDKFAVSDDDIEMMEEYHAIKLHNANKKKEAHFAELSKQQGTEY